MPNLAHQWTVAERDRLPDDGKRYEVIDGELFVTPAPAWRHQDAVMQLYSRIAEYLRIERVGHVIVAPADVVFSPVRGVQPDLFVVPLVNGRPPEHFGDVRRLLLAIEVLSPSTARADRILKRALYREENVPEYWIVDLDARAFERTTPADDRPEVLIDRVAWRPEGARDALHIDISEYFAAVFGD